MGSNRGWLVLVVLVGAGLCLSFAACGDDDDSGSNAGSGQATQSKPTGAVPDDPNAAKFGEVAPGSGEGVKVGYISLGDQIPFVKLVSDGIREEATRAGADLVFCDARIDATKALDCAKNFATQQVDVILNFQSDAKAAPQICAAGPDVPVIAIDIHQEPCEVSFMGANNKRAGEIAGIAAGEYFKEKFDCDADAVVSMQAPGAGEVADTRSQAQLDGFEKVCGKIENLREVDGQGTIEGGQKKFADVLTALPGAEHIVVLTLNDDMALGSLAAAKNQNREADIYLSGQGADPSAHCEIANNPQWIGDTAYFPERYGQILLPNAIKAAKGESIPSKLFVPHVFIDASNIEKYYDVSKC